MKASKTPIGSSAGATIRRQTASATMHSAAPIDAQAGSSTRASEPTIRRPMCGTINPMKPTSPASTTLLAAKSDDAASMIHWARSTLRPTERARSSPIRNALSGEAAANASTAPSAAYGAAIASSGQPRPAIEPANQATTVLAYWFDCARTSASVTIAANSVESETPARIRRLESIPPPRRASAATRTAAPRPATKPIPGVAAAETPATIAIAIAAAAAALTPVRYGSTSGLRSMP